jgi:hypothetical protein
MNNDDIFPVAQPVNATTPPIDPLQVPDPTAGLLPMPNLAPAPRAVSVAGPLPAANPAPAVQPPVPVSIQQSSNPSGVMDYLHSMPSDQAFDTAMDITKGDLRWSLEAVKGFTPDQAAAVQKLARDNNTTWDVAHAGKDNLQNLTDT